MYFIKKSRIKALLNHHNADSMKMKVNSMKKMTSTTKRFVAFLLAFIFLATSNLGGIVMASDELPSGGEGAAINIMLDTSITTPNGDGTVLTGDIFYYVFDYTITPTSSDVGNYGNSYLKLSLPEGVKPVMYVEDGVTKYSVLPTTLLAFDAAGNYEITYQERANVLSIQLLTPLTENTATTVTIALTTDNLVTAGGLELLFQDTPSSRFVFETSYLVDGVYEPFVIPVDPVTITTVATNEWEISKTTVPKNTAVYHPDKDDPGKGYFDVTYQITISNELGVNSFGRLGFLTRAITDTLPTIPAGVVNGDAYEVLDVSILSNTYGTSNTSLIEGTDYKVIQTGDAITGIEFYTMRSVPSGYENVPGTYKNGAGVVVPTEDETTYQYTVRYPLLPYLTDATKEEAMYYDLENTATLTYTLYGGKVGSSTSSDYVSVGGYEGESAPNQITVEKYIRVGTESPVLYDGAAQENYSGAATFGLFTDAACTILARDLDRLSVELQTVGAEGTAIFDQLRFGTYYIGEMQAPDGFQSVAPIEVRIEEDGSISLPGVDTTQAEWDAENQVIKIYNQADTIGDLVFTKKGINAVGGINNLVGVVFTLTNEADTAKTYTVTSGYNGVVHFHGVPAGDYILSETKMPEGLSDIYDVADAPTYKVEVVANTINKPDLTAGESNVFYNASQKGKLVITKVDAADRDTKLNGAVFAVYGPYETEALAEADQANIDGMEAADTMVTGVNGQAISKALAEGYYILEEIQAPLNYVLDKTLHVVQVTKQSEEEVELKNERQLRLSIRKQGTESKENNAMTRELAGATFHIYTDSSGGTPLYGIHNSVTNNWTVVDASVMGALPIEITTYLDPTGISKSGGVYVSPGTYYLEETNTPSPYVKPSERFEVTIEETGFTRLEQVARVSNYLGFGQIKIVKESTENGARLNGAVFGIYSDPNCETEPLQILTTASIVNNPDDIMGTPTMESGVAYSTIDLVYGTTYYVKEITPPDGYARNDTIYSVSDLSLSTPLHIVTVPNDPTTQLQIQKYAYVANGNREPILSGVAFTLYERVGSTNTFHVVAASTNIQQTEIEGESYGIVTFGNLIPGKTYYFAETTIPNGYTLGTVYLENGVTKIEDSIVVGGLTYYPITIKEYDRNDSTTLVTTAIVENIRYGDLRIHKTTNMDDTGANLPGVTFALYTRTLGQDENNSSVSLDAGASLVTTATTDVNGMASFTDLVPGSYWLRETLPVGYYIGTGPQYRDIAVEVLPGDNKAELYSRNLIRGIENDPVMGRIALVKLVETPGSANPIPLANVVFTLTHRDGNPLSPPITITTDAGGIGISTWLEPGTYTMVETVPSGLLATPESYQVLVVAGETTSTSTLGADLHDIVNERQGEFTINKFGVYPLYENNGHVIVGPGVDEPLAGATFTIYKYVADAAPDAGEQVAEFTMDSATYHYTGLNPGQYWLVETGAPEGFEPVAPIQMIVNPDGTVSYDTSVAISNPTMTLRDMADSPRIRIIKTERGNSGVLVDGAIFALYVEDNENGTLLDMNQSGALSVSRNLTKIENADRPDGNYITGTAGWGQALADAGVTAGNTYYVREISVPSGWYFDVDNPWSGPITIPTGSNGEFQIVVENYLDEPPWIIKEYRSDSGVATRLSGAVIAAFENEADAVAMLDLLNTVYNEATNPLGSAANPIDAAFIAANNIWQVTTSAAITGLVEFTGMIPGNTYYIMELAAPGGYQIEKREVSSGQWEYFYHTVRVREEYDTDPETGEIVAGTYQIVLEELIIGASPSEVSSWIPLVIVDTPRRQINLMKQYFLSGLPYYLMGAEFTVYAAREEAGDLVPDTSAAGNLGIMSYNPLLAIYQSALLPMGTYFIRETNIPPGFALHLDEETHTIIEVDGVKYYQVELTYATPLTAYHDVIHITVDNNDLRNDMVVNAPDWGQFVLQKVNANAVAATPVVSRYLSATFTIEVFDEDEEAFVTANPATITTVSGQASILSGRLSPGLYRLLETGVPTNYVGHTDYIYLQIEAGKITNGTTPSLSGQTVDGRDDVIIYQPQSDLTGGATVAPENAVALSMADPIVVRNVPMGQIRVTKYGQWMNGLSSWNEDGQSRINLAGVTFDIYRRTISDTGMATAIGEGATVEELFAIDQISVNLMHTMTTATTGIATSIYLEGGDYWLIETGVGTANEVNYGKDTSTYVPLAFVITPGATPTIVHNETIINTDNRGRFQVEKQDFDTGIALNGAVFEIVTADSFGAINPLVPATYTSVGSMTQMSMPGNYISPLLAEGTYYLIERTTPTNYSNEENLNQVKGPYTVTVNSLSTGSADPYVITNKYDTSLEVRKIDNAEVPALITTTPVQFALYKDADKADAQQALEDGILGNYVRIGWTTADQSRIGTVTGTITWSGLPRGTYWLVELTAPLQYTKETNLIQIELDSSETAVALRGRTTESVTNTLRPSFELKKVAMWTHGTDNTEIATPLEHVTFVIYAGRFTSDVELAGLEEVGRITTDNHGFADSRNPLYTEGVNLELATGWYTLKELDYYGFETLGLLQIYLDDSNPEHAHNNWTLSDGVRVPFETEGPIENVANAYGRFSLQKRDATGNIDLQGATFELQVSDGDGGWIPFTTQTGFGAQGSASILVTEDYHPITGRLTSGLYVSGYIPVGQYRLVEITPPTSRTNANNEPVYFNMDGDKDPIVFEVSNANTVYVEKKNAPVIDLQINKISDAGNGNIALSGAKFKLYHYISETHVYSDDDLANVLNVVGNAVDVTNPWIPSTEQITGGAGVAVWHRLEPGAYWLVETEAPAGYQVMDPVKVIIPENDINHLLYEYPMDLVNVSTHGRLGISKTDSAGNAIPITSPPWTATFDVYQVIDAGIATEPTYDDATWQTIKNATPANSLVQFVETLTVTNGVDAISKLLEPGYYYVEETKAPNGYMLDDYFSPRVQRVTVGTVHIPRIALWDAENDAYAEFKNYHRNVDITYFTGTIDKTVSLDTVTFAGNTFVNEEQTPESLIYDSVTVDFKISGLADGTNNIPAERFVVTDQHIVLQGLKANHAGNVAGDYQDVADYPNGSTDDRDYQVNSVTIYPAYNGESSQIVGAALEYAKGDGAWGNVSDDALLDLSPATIGAGGLTIGLPDDAKGFRLSYENVQAHFVAGDIVMNVTFHARGTWSTVDLPDIRRIVNTAELEWTYTPQNERGIILASNTITGGGEASAAFKLPQYDEKVPLIDLTYIRVGGPADGIYAGGANVQLRATGTNLEVQGQDEWLLEPVMTITIPTNTTFAYLSTSSGLTSDDVSYSATNQSGIRAILHAPDGTALEEHNGQFLKFTLEPVEVTLTDGGGNVIGTEQQWVLVFDTSPGSYLEHGLAPGTSIVIDYFVKIDNNAPANAMATSGQAYLGSLYQLPLTSDNPSGKSFAATQNLVYMESIDETIGMEFEGNGLEYLNQNLSFNVITSNTISVEKTVGASYGRYSRSDVIVEPTDSVYYQLTFTNASTNDLKTIRFVDILPFTGDSLELRSTVAGSNATARDTNLPTGVDSNGIPYDQPHLLAVNANPMDREVLEIRVYYYVGADWGRATRNAQGAASELPMLHTKGANVWDGWLLEEEVTDLSKVTAVGVEVVFRDESLLKTNDTYSVRLEMEAPGYGVSQMNDYSGRRFSNSTAVAVIRANDSNPNSGAIGAADKVASNQVHAYLTLLPLGSIGDYAFYDNNSNGIQDEGDTPVNALPVTLYTTATYADGRKVSLPTKTVLTGHTGEPGYYLFDNLACNLPNSYALANPEAFAADPTNPIYYVEGVYYTYQVRFANPPGYGPTLQYANGLENIEYEPLDSNIDYDGFSNIITLTYSYDAHGNIIGEHNPTIDAGFVKRVNLGDYVWLDANRDGMQGADEIGVNGVRVYLYRLDAQANAALENLSEEAYEKALVEMIAEMSPIAQQQTRTHNGAQGYYCFTDLPVGYYVVLFDIMDVTKDGYTPLYTFTQAESGVNTRVDSNAIYALHDNIRTKITRVIRLLEDDMTIDAGLTVYSAIGGFAFDDEDYDNIQSIYKPLPGTVVTLYRVSDNGIQEELPLATQTVGADGRYFFDNLIEGKYKIHFQFPENYIGVEPYHGTVFNELGQNIVDSEVVFFDDNSRNSGFTDVIVLPFDSVDTTHDAGAYLLSAIGDYCWIDENENGHQDEGEAVIPNVVVYLQQRLKAEAGDHLTLGWETIAVTQTDENGRYWFSGLKASAYYPYEYRVVFGFYETTTMTISKAGATPQHIENQWDPHHTDSDHIDTYISMVGAAGYPSGVVPLGYGDENPHFDAGIIARGWVDDPKKETVEVPGDPRERKETVEVPGDPRKRTHTITVPGDPRKRVVTTYTPGDPLRRTVARYGTEANRDVRSVKTGDELSMMRWLAVLLISGGTVAVVIRRRKKGQW